MKKLGNHNRHRQWTKREKEEEPEVKLAKQTVVEARRVFHGSLRVSHSLRSRASRIAQGDYPLRNFSKGKAILLLAILLVSGVFIADQAVKPTLVVYANPYPTMDRQVLWEDESGSLNAWTCRLATADTVGAKGIILNANTTHSASCITEVRIDLSTVGSKHLEFVMEWQPDTTPGTYPSQWGWFLTRNGTFPTEIADYNPGADINVALMNRHSDGGAGIESATVILQRDPLQTLDSGDPGNCDKGGTTYICSDNTASLPDTSSETSYSQLALNYTGNPGSSTGVKSESLLLVGEVLGNAETAVYPLPHFNFQAQSYYFGIYERARSPDPVGIRWNTDANTFFKIYASTVQGPQVAAPQAIDTGGFFGPIIRALISIGVTILQAIAQFLGFVADVFIDAMDAVGSFFGLGAIGTAIRDALTGTANFIVNVFAVTVGWAVTLASLFQNGIGFITNFFSGSNGFIAWLVSFFSTLPGIWAIIQDFWTALNTVVLGMNMILMIYYIVGMYQVYMTGWNGFRDWLDMGTTFTIKIVKAGFWIGKEMFQIILDVKRLLAQWI